MSEPEEKKVTHRVEISRQPEIDSLHEDLAKAKAIQDELKSKLELASLAEFERQKTELKEKFPQGKSLIDSCTDGKMLQDLESNLKDSYGTGKHIPSGKAWNPSWGSHGKTGIAEEEFSSQAQMVDSLYDRAYFSPRKYTPEEVEDAKQKIDQLLKSMIGGSAWKEMRERGTSPIEKHKLSACPKCHYTLVDTSKCSNCGYDATEKQKVRD